MPENEGENQEVLCPYMDWELPGKILYILRRFQLSSTILGKTHHEARTSILRRLPVHPSQDHQLWAPVPVYTEEVFLNFPFSTDL